MVRRMTTKLGPRTQSRQKYKFTQKIGMKKISAYNENHTSLNLPTRSRLHIVLLTNLLVSNHVDGF